MAGLSGTSVKLVETLEDANEFMRWLGERRPVLAVDTETGGLQAWRDALRLVQFGDATTGWAIPWERWPGLVLEALDRYEGELVAHNAKFDVTFLEVNGAKIDWHRVHDTRVMAHILDPTKATGLKPLSERYIDKRATAGQRLLEEAIRAQGWDWATVPVFFQQYWAYGALDAILTARLFELFRPEIDAAYRRVYDLEMATQQCVMGMERRGMRVDLAYTEAKLRDLETYVAEAARWCRETYGVPPGSNKQVTERLIADGVQLTKRTKTGGWALDEEVLESVQHPLAATVLARRKAEKIAHSYLVNILHGCDGDVVRPSINILGARTGRMSVNDPALQTLPRGRVVRDCFIPREGRVLLSADYSQIELRLMAHFAQEQTMIDVLRSGEDPFTAFARSIYNDESMTKDDPRRQLTKNASYAKLYGAGPRKFAMTAGVEESEGKAFLDAYDARFPGVRAFQQQVEQVASQRYREEGVPYIMTPIGRKQVADDDRSLYKLVNYLIQGAAAEVLKEKIVELDQAGVGEFMLVPVHDEIVWDVPTEDVEDVVATIKRVMPHTGFTVPIPADVDGPYERWGEKYK